MSVPLLTAVTDAVREAELVSAFARQDYGVVVVRRCVDLVDLLAAAAGGTARAVLLSADLRRLDRDALARLDAAGLAVVGLVTPGDDVARRRLQHLGVGQVLDADVGPEAISRAVTAAVVDGVATGGVDSLTVGYTEPRAALPDLDLDAPRAEATAEDAGQVVPGQLVAVWGPTGAPGRTTIAITLAAEAARMGATSLLADADSYGGVVAQLLGLLDESPGLAAATRQANAGSLDVVALARLARMVQPRFRVLTGIARADRWPELRPRSVRTVLQTARRLARLTVVDCGFCLEQDEELVYDTTAPRRNGATFAALEEADVVVAVGSADPVGLQRLVRGLADLANLAPGCRPQVVVNRLRRGPIPGDAEAQISQALARHAGVEGVVFVPDDRSALDAASAAGRTLAEVAPKSPARLALQPLAAQLAGIAANGPGRRRRAGSVRLAR